MDNDDRELERDLHRLEAQGKTHRVTMRVTVEATIDLPGNDHETDDLRDHLDEVLDGQFSIVDWEEV